MGDRLAAHLPDSRSKLPRAHELSWIPVWGIICHKLWQVPLIPVFVLHEVLHWHGRKVSRKISTADVHKDGSQRKGPSYRVGVHLFFFFCDGRHCPSYKCSSSLCDTMSESVFLDKMPYKLSRLLAKAIPLLRRCSRTAGISTASALILHNLQQSFSNGRGWAGE